MADTLSKTKIARSWPTTFAYLGGGVAAAGIGVAIFAFTSGGLWLGSFALAMFILALILVYMSVSGAGVSTCPSCGKALSGLSTGTNDGILCPDCHLYFEGTGGELWKTDPACVAKSPTFSSPLPETFTFPEGCCVCGEPETKRVKISTTTQSGGDAALGAATGLRSSTRISVEVPHCDEHKDGASLTGTKDKMNIRFRSYPYQRAFCELNKTTPV